VNANPGLRHFWSRQNNGSLGQNEVETDPHHVAQHVGNCVDVLLGREFLDGRRPASAASIIGAVSAFIFLVQLVVAFIGLIFDAFRK